MESILLITKLNQYTCPPSYNLYHSMRDGQCHHQCFENAYGF